MKKNVLLLIFTIAFLVSGAYAQKNKNDKKNVISGFVKDQDGQPIHKAIVAVPYSNYSKTTNKRGHYKIKVDSNTERILALTNVNGYIEKDYRGEQKLDFVLPTPSDVNSDDVENTRKLIELGYNRDMVYENSVDAVTFNDRRVNPHKYASFEEMMDKEMNSFDKVVSRFGLYIVDGEYIHGVWHLKDLKPIDVESVKVEDIRFAPIFYGWRGIYGVCKVTTRVPETTDEKESE